MGSIIPRNKKTNFFGFVSNLIIVRHFLTYAISLEDQNGWLLFSSYIAKLVLPLVAVVSALSLINPATKNPS